MSIASSIYIRQSNAGTICRTCAQTLLKGKTEKWGCVGVVHGINHIIAIDLEALCNGTRWTWA